MPAATYQREVLPESRGNHSRHWEQDNHLLPGALCASNPYGQVNVVLSFFSELSPLQLQSLFTTNCLKCEVKRDFRKLLKLDYFGSLEPAEWRYALRVAVSAACRSMRK